VPLQRQARPDCLYLRSDGGPLGRPQRHVRAKHEHAPAQERGPGGACGGWPKKTSAVKTAALGQHRRVWPNSGTPFEGRCKTEPLSQRRPPPTDPSRPVCLWATPQLAATGPPPASVGANAATPPSTTALRGLSGRSGRRREHIGDRFRRETSKKRGAGGATLFRGDTAGQRGLGRGAFTSERWSLFAPLRT